MRSCAFAAVNPSYVRICGRVNLNALEGPAFAQDIRIARLIFQSQSVVFQENLSPSPVAVRTPENRSLRSTNFFSSRVSQLARSGVFTMMNGIANPAATVTAPSRRKIQRQPAIRRMPSKLAMANARRPLKAPEKAEAVENSARRCFSPCRTYQELTM